MGAPGPAWKPIAFTHVSAFFETRGLDYMTRVTFFNRQKKFSKVIPTTENGCLCVV